MEKGVEIMPINFHDKEVSRSYCSRDVHYSWIEEIKKLLNDSPLKTVADIGCGGGIYSKALIELGAESVIGIDYSVPILEQATSSNKSINRLRFQFGTAEKIGLESETMDLVLERALIHHLNEYTLNFQEVHRILKDEGVVIIQDRTPEDCFLPGEPSHIRGYFFSKFPKLIEIEKKRRPTSEIVIEELKNAGFKNISKKNFWEIRKTYESKEKLFEDLLSRKGRSILHEITDVQLDELIEHIQLQMKNREGSITEKDRWTFWCAIK